MHFSTQHHTLKKVWLHSTMSSENVTYIIVTHWFKIYFSTQHRTLKKVWLHSTLPNRNVVSGAQDSSSRERPPPWVTSRPPRCSICSRSFSHLLKQVKEALITIFGEWTNQSYFNYVNAARKTYLTGLFIKYFYLYRKIVTSYSYQFFLVRKWSHKAASIVFHWSNLNFT
jgi:hypothetical protein